jgi:hypothetical protein
VGSDLNAAPLIAAEWISWLRKAVSAKWGKVVKLSGAKPE